MCILQLDLGPTHPLEMTSHRQSRHNKTIYRGKSKGARITEFLNTDPRAAKMTHKQIAVALGVSIGMVARMKKAHGDYTPRPYTRRRDRLGHDVASDEEEAAVAEIIQTNLSTDEKRNLLSRLAESDDVRHEARISAIRELHRIDESVGQAKELGPGDPLTVADRIDRLALLISACGPEVHAAALRLARKEWKDEQRNEGIEAISGGTEEGSRSP